MAEGPILLNFFRTMILKHSIYKNHFENKFPGLHPQRFWVSKSGVYQAQQVM